MAMPVLMMACGAPGIGETSEGQVDTSAEAATVDGLSDAYASFKNLTSKPAFYSTSGGSSVTAFTRGFRRKS